MEWKLTLLRSKFARRIFTLFILCALLPVCILALISFRNVSKQLDDEGWAQLHRASRSHGMNVYERLALLDEEFRMIAAELAAGGAPGNLRAEYKLPEDAARQTFAGTLDPEDLRDLATFSHVRVYPDRQHLPGYLAPIGSPGMRSFLVAPILLKGKHSGFLALGYRAETMWNEEDIAQFGQVADQMAVAITNARLLEELEQLNDETLMALARAIDAKSSWTAGHSERVMQLGVQLGRVMGLSEADQKVLFRGGLLHDIGKIGIPGSLLDKAGKLTPEEIRTMNEHVTLGAKILEPIRGFADLIPIVLHHHER